MITCLGRIVGTIRTADRNDLARQCLEWLRNNKYLLDIMPVFCVEGIEYLCLKDYTYTENNLLAGYFQFHDGDVKVVEV